MANSSFFFTSVFTAFAWLALAGCGQPGNTGSSGAPSTLVPAGTTDRPILENAVDATAPATPATPAPAPAPAAPNATNAPGGTPSISAGPLAVPDTAFEKMLSSQISPQLDLGDDSALTVLPADLKSQISVDSLRALVFNQINQDRQAAGLAPVLYDRLAQRAATIHVLEELEAQHWLSHYSLDGDLPYMRFARVDGVDYDEENAASMSILASGNSTSDATSAKCSGVNTWPAPTSDQVLPVAQHLALALECSMMSEVAPDDGHKKTILNPEATSVGISVGLGIWNETSSTGVTAPRFNIFLVEEFATRGLLGATPTPLSVSLASNSKISFAGQVNSKYKFDSARFYFEKLQPVTPDQAGADLHYSYPSSFEMLMPPPAPNTKWVLSKGAETIKQVVQVSNDIFSFPLTFDKGPGVYSFIVVGKENGTGKAVAIANKSIYVLP